MIYDVDQTLSRLLLRDALSGTDVEVVFEAPTVEWASRRNQPTVNVYLYDIRENVQRREVMATPVYGEDGRVTGRQPPARRFTLSYLLTCWTQRAEDEHRLLSACLGSLLRYDVLPRDLLSGALLEADESALLNVALPPTQDRPVTDLWSALGGELKPSLDVRVTAPFVTSRELPAGPPVLEPLSLDSRGPASDAERRSAASGRPGWRPVQPAHARRATSSLQEVLQGGRGGPISSLTRSVEPAADGHPPGDAEPRQAAPATARGGGKAEPGDGPSAVGGHGGDEAAASDVFPDGVGEESGRWFRVRDLGR